MNWLSFTISISKIKIILRIIELVFKFYYLKFRFIAKVIFQTFFPTIFQPTIFLKISQIHNFICLKRPFKFF
jgi:hypothetical protein